MQKAKHYVLRKESARLRVMQVLAITAVFLFGFGFSGAKAQKMKIVDVSGGEDTYSLIDITKLTFSEGNMTINLSTGVPVEKVLNDIRLMKFTDLSSGIILPEDYNSSPLLLFPNPAGDHLTVRFNLKKDRTVQLRILTIEGKIVYDKNIRSHSGTNDWQLELSNYQTGMYICQLNDGLTIETTRFFKTK